MTDRFRAVTSASVSKQPFWAGLEPELREGLQVVSRVLPFRTNHYVLDQLVDWSRVPDDPIFQLTFPQREMLDPEDYATIRALLEAEAPAQDVEAAAKEIRGRLNPHPAGQLSHNVPRLPGREISGLQHKYRETVLFFPQHGQTCHAYCTYCFRWAQFVGQPELHFAARQADDLAEYLRQHEEVTDVLVTGGDPLIMKTSILRRYLEPLLGDDLAHVRNIRIGTKAVAYWPQRFVSDADADDLLRFFEEIRKAGRSVAIMAHYSHPVELAPEIARKAVERILATGAQLRMQAPLIRRINDNPDAWATMWNDGVQLGMIPYYMFVERDTGPQGYFEVPLGRAWSIFQQAYQRVSGLARSVRGPSTSAFPGKVRIL
jgi:KamA family protein